MFQQGLQSGRGTNLEAISLHRDLVEAQALKVDDFNGVRHAM